MSYEIAGKIIVKSDTQVISDRFKKREFVILKEENNAGTVFTDHIKFQLTQDRVDLLNDVNLEDEIKVTFNVRGNKWEKDGKTNYFTNLDAWRIEKLTPGEPASESAPFPDQSQDILTGGEEDDLPF